MQRRSNSQTLAAFSAAARQYDTTVFSGHAGTEAVSTSALDSAWLESTFHDAYLVVTEEPVVAPLKETAHFRETRSAGQFDIAFSASWVTFF